MKFTRFLFALFALSCTACAAFPPAQMALPESLLPIQPQPITGLGGTRSGTYRLAEYSGTFKRSATRLVFFDVFDRRSASAEFTLQDPALEQPIAASCRMRERLITIKLATFTPKKMAYGCDFTAGGRAFPARFELQEVREGIAGMLSKKARRGELALDRVTLQIQSVHRLQGSGIETAQPIGYLFLAGTDPVAAVELNGRPRMFYPATTDAAMRRAVSAGALALALLWDPEETGLAD